MRHMQADHIERRAMNAWDAAASQLQQAASVPDDGVQQAGQPTSLENMSDDSIAHGDDTTDSALNGQPSIMQRWHAVSDTSPQPPHPGHLQALGDSPFAVNLLRTISR